VPLVDGTDNGGSSNSNFNSSAPHSQDSTSATQLLGASQIAPAPEIAVLTLLRSLRPHGLRRTDRLRRDLATLAGIRSDEVDGFLAAHRSDAAQAFVEHIEAVVAERPHVLVAYAFVLYMAIFSGGRWIRSVLASAGPGFWSAAAAAATEPGRGAVSTCSPPGSPELLAAAWLGTSVHEKLRTFSREQQERYERLGLSFWFWSSLEDGLDIKAEFKRRLDGIERLLTEDMRREVVEEAREVFVRCESLVGELDELVGRQGEVVEGLKSRQMKESQEHKTVVLHARKKGGFMGLWPRRPWIDGGFIGLALAVSSVSWYAMYHAGLWDAA
jgi:heme oxygenase